MSSSRRRFLAHAAALTLAAPAARAQDDGAVQPAPDVLRPGSGEVLVAGEVRLVIPAESRVILAVSRLVTPGGGESAFDPPRLRTVYVPENALWYSEEGAPAALEALNPGAMMTVVGANRGRGGGELPARAVRVGAGDGTDARAAIARTAAERRLGTPRAETPAPVRTPAPRSDGWLQAFERGWVYWTPAAGARTVLGTIFGAWAQAKWEQGPLGFPLTDELRAPAPDDRDRYQVFEGGVIYWHAADNRAAVLPALRSRGASFQPRPAPTPPER